MSAFKQFLAKDIKLVPFTVNKDFDFNSSEFSSSIANIGTYKEFVGIDRYLGTNLSGSLFETSTDPTTGAVDIQYQRQVYESVKELYYSNFLSSSWGDPSTAIPTQEISGSINTPSYYNYLSSTLTASRHFPTASSDIVSVTSIPSKLFGEYIQPKSFKLKYTDSSSAVFQVYDDGEGNLYSSASYSYYSQSSFQTQSSEYYGVVSGPLGPPSQYSILGFQGSGLNIPTNYVLNKIEWLGDPNFTPFYDVVNTQYLTDVTDSSILATIALSTNQMLASNAGLFYFNITNGQEFGAEIRFSFVSSSFGGSGSIAAHENVGNIIYEHGMAIFTNQNAPIRNLTIHPNVTCSFLSSKTIYEAQYKCTVRDNEYNFSLNPSLSSGSTSYSGSNGTFYTPSEYLYNYATGSYFSPYITTVGLYDNDQNLLAVAKLAQPIQSSNTTDTTILVNLDL